MTIRSVYYSPKDIENLIRVDVMKKLNVENDLIDTEASNFYCLFEEVTVKLKPEIEEAK